jgi:hypothetical protein
MIFLHVDRFLAPYLHGELQESDRAQVDRHLAQCQRCRALVDRLRAVHANLSGRPVQSAPDSLWQRIEQAIDTGASVRESARRPPVRRIAWAAGVLGVAAAGLIGYVTVQNQRRPYWDVTRLQGRPRIGWLPVSRQSKLRVGDELTTDRSSSAEIKVADIGTVKIDPNSVVRLKASSNSERRLELEKGALEAKVTAPPRIFVVDTQSGRAVDLGCAYRLQTAGSDTTQLHVTRGAVSLEDRGRSSLVLQGFTCESRRGAGLGTPVKDDAPDALRKAVSQFDFEAGGDEAAERARSTARPQDAITLWHLLGRSSSAERGRLFDSISALSHPPPAVTRAAVISGDAKMLDLWLKAIREDLGE